MNRSSVLWNDRKRTFLGLPWSFTRYSFSDSRLYLKTGMLSLKEEELLLYRIMDISLVRSLGQRIFGIGSIRLITADKTHPELVLKNIKNAEKIKDHLSLLVEEAREKNRVSAREFFEEDDHDHDGNF